MAPAKGRQRRQEGLLQDLAGGFGRQDIAQGRAVEAIRRGKGGSRGIEQGAALLDVMGDVLEIGPRQHALAPVAIEDDEVELLKLQFEQVAHRKGD